MDACMDHAWFMQGPSCIEEVKMNLKEVLDEREVIVATKGKKEVY